MDGRFVPRRVGEEKRVQYIEMERRRIVTDGGVAEVRFWGRGGNIHNMVGTDGAGDTRNTVNDQDIA